MKKTILALAVPALLAAGVTNAATVYSNDGTTIDLKGSLRLLAQDGSAQKDASLDDDGSRIGLGVKHDLGNGLSGLAYIEMGYNSQLPETDSKSVIKNRQAYAGLSMDGVGTLTAGRITAPFDDVAMSDYTYTYGGVMDFGKMADSADRGPFGQKNTFLARTSNSVKIESADFSGFKAAASYTMKTGDKHNDIENAYTLAAFYESDFGLTVNAGYGHGKSNGSSEYKINSTDASIWGLGAQYQIADFAIALDYGQAKLDYNTAGDATAKANLLGVGVKYQVIEPTQVYAGFYNKDYKDFKDLDRANRFVVGTDYKFSKNVVTFLEYAHDDVKKVAAKTDKDDTIGLGLRVYF